MYVTKGKLDCCIVELSVQQSTSKLPGNLADANVELDHCIDQFSVQQDYNRLVDNLLEAKEELDCGAQHVQIVEAANYFREKQEAKTES